jgi:hypothetical protein
MILFALPTSRSGFEWSRGQPDSDYAKRFLLGWDQYEDVCDDLSDAVERYKALGVRSIVLDARRENWITAFAEAEVVIIFAHWLECKTGSGAVEFWDGPFSVEAMVEQIPPEFEGVIDLSVCHPFGFADRAARQKPNCSVWYAEKEVSPSIWAEFYSSIFEVLRQSGMDYREAATRVVLEYRRQSKRGKKTKFKVRRDQ